MALVTVARLAAAVTLEELPDAGLPKQEAPESLAIGRALPERA